MVNRIPFLLLVLLAGCAAKPTVQAPEAGKAETAGEQFRDIAATPLSDLNLVRAKIPAVLLAARKAPYAVPEDRSCTALSARVAELDEVLGPDLDRSRKDADEGLVERGADLVGDAALDAARSAAAGILPFRSWFRKLSGAERHSKEVSAAIAAGIVRRAYLKGMGQAGECPAPAAPTRPEAGYSSGTKPSDAELRQ